MSVCFSIVSISTYAEKAGRFSIEGGTEDADYSYADGVLTIFAETPIIIKNTAFNTATTDQKEQVIEQMVETTEQTQKKKKMEKTIQVPLPDMVPIPALIREEVIIDFDMEVKSSEPKQGETETAISDQGEHKSWFGVNANITGKVSSESSHKRETDSSATYNVHACVTQQPAAKKVETLVSSFPQMLEPIATKDISKEKMVTESNEK